ncbi:MAG: hypothetical protein GOMPHAMPRED_000535 [Gomphillus americanus]|uniref:SUN domain-containing protein n=1 Tax=Gomphillus americanus TaxID=1940652 RepID=A0A8H3EEH0_9LECA|nr:MAG: hypothetical protein GOMPHAMPRED_000535 [Gomphillus americanus]
MARKKAPNAKTPVKRAIPDAAKAKPQPVITVTDRRPSVANAVSKAYGAPGNAKMPRKQDAKPDGPMLHLMKNMAGQDMLSDLEDSEDDNVSEDGKYNERLRQESIEHEQWNRIVARTFEPQMQNEDGSEDELDVNEERSKGGSDIREEFSRQNQNDSPFATVAKRISGIWKRPESNIQTSFIAEDKIASEARIARPRKGLARRVIELKEKMINLWPESAIIRNLLVVCKYFIGALVILFVFQAIQSNLPEEVSVFDRFAHFGERITAPAQTLLGKISSTSRQNPAQLPQDPDLSQLKSLKDSTSAQFKHLKSRLDNIEATYNQMARKAKTQPIPARRINLFASGSGLTVDPYLTSPTRARDTANRYLVTRWFSRWRGWPDSIHHGPLAAFTPWEDMGDCWCTPDSGGSAQIVVTLAQPVVPKELVVEHVSKHATLQAGSAPKNIELWAQIKDSKLRNAIVKGALQYGIHQNALHERDDQIESLEEDWIRIGQWTYNIDGTSHIQTFEIQIPLEDFGAPVDSLAFRALDNWGPVKYVCLYRLKLHGLVANSKSEQLNGIGY